MGPGYFMVGAVHMGQIRLALFARNDVYAAVSNVRTSKQATGVAGVATNKVGARGCKYVHQGLEIKWHGAWQRPKKEKQMHNICTAGA